MLQFAALALAGVGAGMSIFGAREAADAQKQITQAERQIEGQRFKAMELDARRKQLEMFRNAQRARAMALSTATSQGAQHGSALAGAYGQISGQTGVNLLGVNQNLAIGRNIFDLNAQVSQGKMDMADAQAWSATGASLTGLGGSLVQNFKGLNSLTSQYFGMPIVDTTRPPPATSANAYAPFGPGY